MGGFSLSEDTYGGEYEMPDGTRVYVSSDQPSEASEDMPHAGGIKPNNQPSPAPAGNTQGIIVPQTAPEASGAGNSAPTPEPTEEEEGWWGSWGSALVHGTLDVVGLIPVVGEVADGVNAVLYLAEGKKAEAVISMLAMAPFGGQAATVAKLGMKGAEATKAAGKATAEAGAKATREGAEAGAEQASKRTTRGKDGGHVNGPKIKKKRRPNKPRQPRTYEKKVENPDGSTTYTLKTKEGEVFDVTYKDGYPDFSKYKYEGGKGLPEVEIDVTGKNPIDFRQANIKAGFGKGSYSHPKDFTWHHDLPSGKMQLIRKDIHGSSPHTGSASAARNGVL